MPRFYSPDPPPCRERHEPATHAVVIIGDWMRGRDEASRDARSMAFDRVLGAYRITGSCIAIKGSLRRVRLHIEWTE